MKRSIVLILVWGFWVLTAQTLTDTLWSVPQLDGEIAFRPASGIFNMSTSSPNFYPGDGFDFFLYEEVFSRAYLCFDLGNLFFSDTLTISNVTIGIYQVEATGNGQPGVYPIWNVAGGDTHFCVLDHIDYGSILNLGDFTAGDPGDPQTLHANIGIISDNADPGYKTLDVTPYVLEDIANQRIYNQYRMRFTIDLDYDSLGDKLLFKSGNSITPLKPYLAVQYDSLTALITNISLSTVFELKQNYPNPFNAITQITYLLRTSGIVKLEVYNTIGKRITSLVNAYQFPDKYKVVFDAGDLPSGIYYYRIKMNNYSITKKMLLIR